jgi:glucose repression regulatory protein TUP1
MRESKRIKTERPKIERPGEISFSALDHVHHYSILICCARDLIFLSFLLLLDHFSPSLGPAPQKILTLPTSSAPGVGPGLPPPPSVHTSYSSGPVSGHPPTSDQAHPSANSISSIGAQGNQYFDDMDPATVPPELKKDGADWFAVFSPKTKRVLDVNLVHTLVHERWACCIHICRRVTYEWGSVVCCVRFSADGKYLATGCNRTAQIYDTKTGAKTWCVSLFQS